MLSRKKKNVCLFKGAALSACLSAAVVLGGCAGYDGIELQGGIFDALGVSGSGQKKLADVKVEPRPGLVLPPSPERLPEPATGSIAAAPQGEAWPVDPEDRRASNKVELEKRHKAYCEREIQNARMRGEQSGVIMGPMGNCQPGLFGSLSNQFTGR